MDQPTVLPIVLSSVIQGELPFTLNLDEGSYTVLSGGVPYSIDLLQDRFAVVDGPERLMVGTREDLKRSMGERWDAAYNFELRTLVRARREVKVQPADLPKPTDQQLFEAAQLYLLKTNQPDASGPEELQKTTREFMKGMSAEEQDNLVSDTSVRLAADGHFPRTEVAKFCIALNALVRLYMAKFKDRFVQEVTEGMFSGTAMRGIRHSVFCNGHELDSTRHTGGYMPFIIRRQWLSHPPQDVQDFRSQLGAGLPPDPVALLHVRANSLLLRGAYRSAMLEASAAFDLCLVRKIRAGFANKGKADPEIQAILDAETRYENRAKALLKDAVGKSVPEVDNVRWEQFRKDRKQRGSIAHSANEPDAKDATESVENMIALTEAIDQLPV
jgi:hypothetical protein